MSTLPPRDELTSTGTSRGRSRRRRGFSIVEVMLALAVLAVGILATTAGQMKALRQSADSRYNMLALSLAEQQMEIFRLMDSADVLALTADGNYPNDPSNPIDAVAADDSTVEFNRRWIIENDTPEAGVIRITVEVDWQNSLGSTRTARIQGLKAS